MTTEIDRIWSYSATELLEHPDSIPKVIEYYKKLMGSVDAGVKPKKSTAGDNLRLEDVITMPKVTNPLGRRQLK